jgi:hypothetical protein
MAKGCRDCKRCTELGIKTLSMLPVRTTVALANVATLGVLGLFQRKCPHCGHKMSDHKLEDKVS